MDPSISYNKLKGPGWQCGPAACAQQMEAIGPFPSTETKQVNTINTFLHQKTKLTVKNQCLYRRYLVTSLQEKSKCQSTWRMMLLLLLKVLRYTMSWEFARVKPGVTHTKLLTLFSPEKCGTKKVKRKLYYLIR